MACAEPYGIGRAREVGVVAVGLVLFALLPQCVYAFNGCLLKFVDFNAHFLFLLRRNVTEVGHKSVDFAFLAEIFKS